MSIVKEFREFAMRGNVVDLAVGIIIGGAFGKIVSSVVSDVLMPPIGLLVGGVDFSGLGITLKAAQGEATAVMIRYGAFINAIIDFIIIAAAVFFLIRVINSLKKKEPPAPPPAPPRQELLLEEIRDILKKGR